MTPESAVSLSPTSSSFIIARLSYVLPLPKLLWQAAMGDIFLGLDQKKIKIEDFKKLDLDFLKTSMARPGLDFIFC